MVENTGVLIVGGGPVGLSLSAQLGAFGIDNILVNRELETSKHPKCNLVNARSMEHFRKMGVARKLRQVGLPSDYPQDVVYFTRLSKPEIARIRIPSSAQVEKACHTGDERWPTPEPPYRVSQIYTELVLKQHALLQSSSSIQFGWELVDFSDDNAAVTARIRSVNTGEERSIRSSWLVGCDGGAGYVRPKLGIEYEGEGGAKRAFMGGAMLATYYSSPDLAKILARHEPGHMLWAYNNDFVSVTVRINGSDTFLTHIQLPEGDDPECWRPEEFIPKVVGEDVSVKVLSMSPWSAGLRLVASSFQRGRCLIAGDAAHLFTPTGGFGMNTGIDDAANLAWKLAADVDGWAGCDLVASYNAERRPVGLRNTSAAQKIAEIMGAVRVPDDIELDNAKAMDGRRRLTEALLDLARYEFQTVGVQLGVRYNGSSIVCEEDGCNLPDDIVDYVPSSAPGSRAPHTFLADDTSIYDLFGPAFTLLDFGAQASDVKELEDAAKERCLPMITVPVLDSQAARLYEKRLVLIRPDMHVAWRGDRITVEAMAIIDKIRGVRE
ncbi:hypothetical protein HBA55_33015 [Pseudomaricurvus alkylphenolicus]|uniref:FAD-dependent monooxygenase n=1 Tax=Pseudomaricurvus alkylphenolicus TaxID=1306991 RepID=UPI001421A09D|nr:FAD-dependent monooxygenase [Pseudomaricurvus alkylphenolicus]NIB44456.1 hypothetical protein [Pseudomaricurvus alkylphenolicus]